MAAPTNPRVRGPSGRAPGGWGGGGETGGPDKGRLVAGGEYGQPEHGVCPLLLFAGVYLVYVESGARGVADIAALTEFGIGLGHGMSQRREILVARRAVRSSGRDGADGALRIQHGVLADGEDGFRTGDMAHVAFGGIGDSAGGRHGGITHVGEIVMAAAEPDDDVGPIEGLHGFAGVDLVDHEGEVDGLGREGLVGCDGGGTAGGSIVLARVVAEHAHFDLVAVLAVEGKIAMAAVALGDVHYSAARGHFGAIDREVGDLIDGAVFAGLLLGGTSQQRTAAAGFDADGIGAGGLGRYRVGEGVSASAAGVALGGGDRVFGYVPRGDHVGTETGVAIVRGRTGHYQSHAVAAAGQLSHGDGGAGVVFGGEGDGGRLAGDAVIHLNDGHDDAGVGEGLSGNGVRANDGSVELRSEERRVGKEC